MVNSIFSSYLELQKLEYTVNIRNTLKVKIQDFEIYKRFPTTITRFIAFC